MKKLIIIVLLFSVLFIYADEKKEIIDALKLQKISEELNLNENQIAKYLTMEKDIKEIHKKYGEKNRDLIEGLEKDVKNNKFSNADNILNSIEKNENKKFAEINKIRRKFFNSLNNEQKAKLILFEAKFREKIKDFILNRDKPGRPNENFDKRKLNQNKEER